MIRRNLAPLLLSSGVALVLLLAGCGASSMGGHDGGSANHDGSHTNGGAPASGSASPTGTSPSATTGTSAGPWALSTTGAADRIKAAGLAVLNAEGTAEHYHAHLDIYTDGLKVPVPADVGFVFGSSGQPTGISALHTHDGTGILHIEAPTQGDRFTLLQALAEWGVATPASGSVIAGAGGWHITVNGQDAGADPAAVVLSAHQEIVLYRGAAPADPPSSYAFPAGY